MSSTQEDLWAVLEEKVEASSNGPCIIQRRVGVSGGECSVYVVSR